MCLLNMLICLLARLLGNVADEKYGHILSNNVCIVTNNVCIVTKREPAVPT